MTWPRKALFLIIACVASTSGASLVKSATGKDVQARMTEDIAAGRPIVVHVVVALCDNANQGIVPVTKTLGNGQNPRTNLYWGAAFGLKTYFSRQSGFKKVKASWDRPSHVLDSVVFKTHPKRNGSKVDLFIVAEAWDGSQMSGALTRFLRFSAGRDRVPVKVDGLESPILAGGDSALVAFVGHNGLMDMSAPVQPVSLPKAKPRSSIVLACASRYYFHKILTTAGSHSLLLTNGLMAPEAYTLEAALSSFAKGQTSGKVREAAASAYNKYQRCGQKAARGLFSSDP